MEPFVINFKAAMPRLKSIPVIDDKSRVNFLPFKDRKRNNEDMSRSSSLYPARARRSGTPERNCSLDPTFHPGKIYNYPIIVSFIGAILHSFIQWYVIFHEWLQFDELIPSFIVILVLLTGSNTLPDTRSMYLVMYVFGHFLCELLILKRIHICHT